MKRALVLPFFILMAAVANAATEAGAVLDKLRPSVVEVNFAQIAENDSHIPKKGVGAIVSEDGLVVFSGDLLPRSVPDDRFAEFKIKLVGEENPQELAAELLQRDEDLHTAVLRVTEKRKDGKPLVPLAIADAAALQPGENVYGVGLLPASYQTALNIGAGLLIRKTEKPQHLWVVSASSVVALYGPVANAKGEVIGFGVNDPLFDSTGYARAQQDYVRSRGQSANPNDLFQRANVVLPYYRLADLLKDPSKQRKRSWLGVSDLQPLTKDLATVLGQAEDRGGVIIGRVLEGQSAERSGLKAEDVIVKLNGEDVKVKDETGLRTFQERIKKIDVGAKSMLTVLRGKEEKNIELTMGEKPKEENEAMRFEDKDLGLLMREMVYYDALARDLPADFAGLFVHYVKPGSWPELGGMRAGDILVKVDDVELKGNDAKAMEQFKGIIADYKKQKKKNFVFFVSRGKKGQNSAIIKLEADWVEDQQPAKP